MDLWRGLSDWQKTAVRLAAKSPKRKWTAQRWLHSFDHRHGKVSIMDGEIYLGAPTGFLMEKSARMATDLVNSLTSEQAAEVKALIWADIVARRARDEAEVHPQAEELAPHEQADRLAEVA